jgi:hypothetical protein
VALADPASGSSTAESLWLLGKQRISDDEMELALRINVLPGSFARIHFDTNQIALCALGSLHNFGNDEWSNARAITRGPRDGTVGWARTTDLRIHNPAL